MNQKELLKRIEELEDKVRRLENPTYPIMPNLPTPPTMFEAGCLHNGCGHNKKGGNIACMLYCPHCSPMS